MRLTEIESTTPEIGDIVEIEIGDTVVETVVIEVLDDGIVCETDSNPGNKLMESSFERVDEDLHPHHKKAIKGMHQLSGDQYIDYYKFNKDVAGHDGKKQTSPGGDSDYEISDKPFAYAYTDEEEDMIKGADPKAKKITSSKSEELDEAEYHGRQVKLGKPMQGDVKKSKVYVRNPKTGKVVKVNFGDPNMRIHKSNPKRRKSFRARHNCANPGPRTKARYWSCRKW